VKALFQYGLSGSNSLDPLSDRTDHFAKLTIVQ